MAVLHLDNFRKTQKKQSSKSIKDKDIIKLADFCKKYDITKKQ